MNPEQRRAWHRYVLGCNDLTPAQRLVLLALETYADYTDGTNARPGVMRLAETCGVHTRTVDTALERGRFLELIEQTSRANPKRGQAAVYRLLSNRTDMRIEPPSIRTDIRVETDFNPHDNAFQSARNGVSTRTSMRATTPVTPQQNTEKDGTRAKSTYLPDGWSPPLEVVVQMRVEQPHIDQDLELRKFCDHWRSATRNAMKRDWTAAYRNWVRNAAKWTAPHINNGVSRGDAKIAGWQTIPVHTHEHAHARKELDP